MGLQIARRRARFTMLFAGAVVAFGVAATPAFATSSTIDATTATANPEQAVPVDVTISGTNNSGAAAYLDVVIRPAGGLSCQASYTDDMSALGFVNTVIVAPGTESMPTGSYQQTVSYKPPSAASYELCAWLDPSLTGSAPVAGGGPAEDTFTARSPQVSELQVTAPKPLTPNTPFTITYTTQTDQQLTLYSALIPAATGTQCAGSYEAQSAQTPRMTSLLGDLGDTVFGGPLTNTATTVAGHGPHLICTWVEGPNRAEADASASTPITIGSTAVSPSLKLTKVKASHRHGISVAGTTASQLSGRLQAAAVCGSATSSATLRASGGHFSGHLRTPHACARGRHVKLTITWRGSAAFTSASASKVVTLKP